MSESFAERVKRLAAEREARANSEAPAGPPAPTVEHDPDLIPDVEPYERSESDLEIERIIEGIDILDAYDKYVGKMKPKVGSKRESIMISCPKPDHPDRNPSAWINLDKGTWFCGSCQEGGDKFDLAAQALGFGSDYQSGSNFPALLKAMAEREGYVVRTTPAGTTYVEEQNDPEPDVEPAEEAGETESSDPKPRHLAAVPAPEPDEPVAFDPTDDLIRESRVIDYPSINWRSMLPDMTFLRRWMECTAAVDDVTSEYYFWLGLEAIGLAAGRECVLADSPEVTANLFVCLYGPSGDGKSRSIRPLMDLLRKALPYDHDDEHSTGAHIVPSPGSAEALVDSFSKPVYDPTNPKKLLYHAPVRGMVRLDELSTLMSRASRAGSAMKPTLMEFYDCYHRVELKSRGAGLVVAEQPFANIVTTTQPKAMKDLVSVTDARSGFLNRWIMACGPGKTKVPFGRTGLSIDRCIDPLREIRAFASTSHQITMTDEALDIWSSFFHDVLEPDRSGDNTDLLTRGDLILKKIMLLLALDRHETAVSAATCVDAISLWDYIKASYQLIQGELRFVDQFEEARIAIREACERFQERTGEGATMRDLNRLLAHKDLNIMAIRQVLPAMVQIQELEERTTQGKRGPKTTRYWAVS